MLESLRDMDIDMIAPDHGLIFRGDDVAFALDTYQMLAEQKPQKRAVIVYDTMWHTTEKMAMAIGSGLESVGVPMRIMSLKKNHHSAVMTELSNCGAVIMGSPTHNNGVLPLVSAMLTYMKGLRPKNRVGAAFGSYGWSGESAQFINDALADMGMDMVGSDAVLRQQWGPDHQCLAACFELGKQVGEALMKKIAEGA